jgi:hypothetical protein
VGVRRNTVAIGGSACAISSQSATQVVCTLSQHAGGVFDVQLLSPSAGLATPKQFTYSVGIVDVQPRAGSLYGGTLVTITGHGSASDADVAAGFVNDARFGPGRTAQEGTPGAWDLQIVTQSYDTIVARTGISYACRGSGAENAEGTATALRMDVVRNSTGARAAGTASSVSFAYQASATPDVLAISPALGSSGTALTITGSNFAASTSANTVTIAGTACAIVTATASKITCTVGGRPTTGSARDVLVYVQGKGYAGCSGCPGAPKALPQFRYSMTVTAVQPNKGSLGGGQLVRVSGFGLTAVASVQARRHGAGPQGLLARGPARAHAHRHARTLRHRHVPRQVRHAEGLVRVRRQQLG